MEKNCSLRPFHVISFQFRPIVQSAFTENSDQATIALRARELNRAVFPMGVRLPLPRPNEESYGQMVFTIGKAILIWLFSCTTR